MPVRPDTTYALRELYEAIDLLDRKIPYCENLETFETGQARESARLKLVQKRALLVKAALAMAGRGVACDRKYLPRSFKANALESEVAS